MNRVPLWGYVLAFVVQAALLGGMLADRALLIANGTEIRLPAVPVDPRDFLRGDYVVLSYPMSQLRVSDLAGEDEFAHGDPIFVEVAPEGDIWQPVALHRSPPRNGVAVRGEVTSVATRADCVSACDQFAVGYNLEKFFVPEGEGLEIEKLRNEERVRVDVAVADSGRAALKRLRVDGEVRYEESLF